MTDDDLIFGARSGIQKAIRRGDLDLCKTSFDLIWSEKEHRNWLKWRTPVLIGEEAFYFAGEAAKLIKEKSNDEEAWRKLLYRLTLIRKNKDAGGLEFLGRMAQIPGEENFSRQLLWELEQMRAAYAMGDDPGTAATAMFKEFTEKNTLTPYELEGMEVLRNRVFAGGMLGDRWMLVASLILMASRPCNKKLIAREEKWGIKRWTTLAGKRKPRMMDLPWYVFDMHTQAGKIVLSAFTKHYQDTLKFATKREIEVVWFHMESGLVPDDFQVAVDMDEESVGCVQSAWWPLATETSLQLHLSKWDSVDAFRSGGWPLMQEKLESLVQWALERRVGR
jgi:hypothetical protein